MIDYALAETIRPVVEKKNIPLSVIQAIVETIAKKFNPEKVILYGSYAYGDPQPWSDVDLLVIMDTDKNPIEIGLEIRRALPRYHFSLDLLARSQPEIDRRLKANDGFLREIMTKGKVLYERRVSDNR